MADRKKDPTIAELLAKAAELGLTDEAQARALIKAHSVRSFKRLAEAIANPDAAPAPKAKAKAKGKSKVKAKSNGGRRPTGILHKEGPRGFKFGPVWLASVKAQKGVAMKPSNHPKLEKTAIAYGVDSNGLDHKELVAAISKAMGTRREPIPPKMEKLEEASA